MPNETCRHMYCQQVHVGEDIEAGEPYCREDEHPCDLENGKCRIYPELIPVSPERIQEMLAEGQWCYSEPEAKLINIGTGEMVTHIDWLTKEIK